MSLLENIGFGQMVVQGNFKLARSFYWLCHLHCKIKIKHTWSFFESGHGKGEHDGA